MSIEEQRRYARRPLAVEFRGRDAAANGQLVFTGADLSAGGTFLRCDLLLEQDETLQVDFRVPGVQRNLHAHARVAWVRRFPEEDAPGGMGIEFLAMSSEDRTALEQFLAGRAP